MWSDSKSFISHFCGGCAVFARFGWGVGWGVGWGGFLHIVGAQTHGGFPLP